MRLDNDCVRDILLYVEENIDQNNSYIRVPDLITFLNSKYDKSIIYYHIIKLNDANLFKYVVISDDNIPHRILDLSCDGQIYVDNIRDDKVWSKVKSITKGLSSISVPLMIECAKTVITNSLSKP